VEEQVAIIFAGVRGYLDKTPINRVTAFEGHLRSELKANGQEILSTIRSEQAISEETDSKLGAFMEGVVKSFAG